MNVPQTGNATAISETIFVGPRSISGTVRDRRGKRMAGVTITLKGKFINQTVVSDARGAYKLSGLTRGKYNLSASLPGFVFKPKSMILKIDRKNLINRKFTGKPVRPAQQ